MLRQSKTVAIPQISKGINNTIFHFDYVYLTDIPSSVGYKDVINVLKCFEWYVDDKKGLSDIQLVCDDMTEKWIFKFKSNNELDTEYSFNTDKI